MIKFKNLSYIFNKAREKETDYLEIDEDSEPNNFQFYKPRIC